MTQDSYLGENGTPPSLNRYLYAFSNPMIYVDLYGYAVVKAGTQAKFYANAVEFPNQFIHIENGDDIDAIMEANPDMTRYEAVEFLREKLSGFGLSRDNYMFKGFVTVENGDGLEKVKKEVIEYLGEGFANMIAGDRRLKRRFHQHFLRAEKEGRLVGGQVLDISEFWDMAYSATLYRAIYENQRTEPYRHVYEGKAKGYEVFDKWIASVRLHAAISLDDNLAPPSERLVNSAKLGVDIVDMATLAYGAGKLSLKAASLAKNRFLLRGATPKDIPTAADLVQNRSEIIRNSMPRRTQPRATSVVVDARTGKAYTGDSGMLPSDIHPTLKNRMPKQSLERWQVNNCAEFDAVNKALKDGANLNDLEVHTITVRDGVNFPRCKNCQVTTDGVTATSD